MECGSHCFIPTPSAIAHVRTPCSLRASPLAGRILLMDSVAMSLFPLIILPLFSQSKVQLCKGRHPRKTSSTTICMYSKTPCSMTNTAALSLFSCCCARVDISWAFRTVCDCYSHSWRCDSTCLTKALIEDSLFYSIGVVS